MYCLFVVDCVWFGFGMLVVLGDCGLVWRLLVLWFACWVLVLLWLVWRNSFAGGWSGWILSVGFALGIGAVGSGWWVVGWLVVVVLIAFVRLGVWCYVVLPGVVSCAGVWLVRRWFWCFPWFLGLVGCGM